MTRPGIVPSLVSCQLRYGPECFAFGDPFDGILTLSNSGRGRGLMSGLKGAISAQWYRAILEFASQPITFPGFLSAEMQRDGEWFGIDLTKRPFRMVAI